MKLRYTMLCCLLTTISVSQLAHTQTGPSKMPVPEELSVRLLRAQVLLERLSFSPGEIDGAYGANMRQALLAFQVHAQLAPSGELDQPTWDALNRDASPTLVDYLVTPADIAGPYRKVPASMQAKARLKRLGYASAAEELGEKFRTSPTLLARLNPQSTLARAGETIQVPNVSDKPPLARAARIVVYASTKVLQLHDADGQILAQYPVTTGGRHDPLPIGSWEVSAIFANPIYHYNPKLFWDAPPGDRPVRVQPGPNNPVGVVWIGLSKPRYGIHGTPSPGLIGKTQSHGCIRMTNWSAAEVAQLVQAGTPVELRN